MHLQNIMQNFLLLLINCIFKINLMTERCGRRWGVSDRRGCSFSHELNSDRNDEILREHGLESLSRTELCTLLLQSDNTLLPPVSLTTYNMHLQESFKQLTVWICGKKKLCVVCSSEHGDSGIDMKRTRTSKLSFFMNWITCTSMVLL